MALKYFLLPIFLLRSFTASAQTEKTPTSTRLSHQKVFTHVEEMPKAQYDVTAFLANHLSFSAPDSDCVLNKIVVQFVVAADGTIIDPKVTRSANMDCNTEILRVFKLMPPWKPGRQNGQNVATRFTLPIILEPAR